MAQKCTLAVRPQGSPNNATGGPTFSVTGSGDGVCPQGSSIVAYDDVTRYLELIKQSGIIPQWGSVRIGGGGALDGSGYGYSYRCGMHG